MSIKFNRLKTKAVKDNKTYVFSNFDQGLYLLDTPRSLGEQLASLALIGGRNIIVEKGALVPQFGYEILAELPEGEFVAAISKDNKTTGSFFLITQAGKVYLYTSAQGLKLYKTELGPVSELVIAHDGPHLIAYNNGQLYLFGSFYKDAESVSIATDVTLSDYDQYYQFTVTKENAIYYWNGKGIAVTGTINGESVTLAHTVISMTQDPDTGNYTIRTTVEGNHVRYENSGLVSIAEQTILAWDAIYYPEDYNPDTPAEDQPEEDQPKQMTPQLLEVCTNRLFIVDISGRIYYSQIGGIDAFANSIDPLNYNGFREELGAGYFEGFYRDTTKTLAIEDYMSGALVTKEDGLYYLQLTAPTYQYTQTGPGGEGILSLSQNNTSIKKIANIGQKYATDHVIVREQVIAYDTWSGSIVEACGVNVFGQMVSGNVIIDQRFLNSQNSGINSTRRCLAYNGLENLFTLYYGENLNYGIVLTLNSTIFPRQLDINIENYIGFNQGVVGVTLEGKIIQEYKANTVIENIPACADFEAIGLRDNRFSCASILEITELNGVEYSVTTKNAGTSMQNIKPPINQGLNGVNLPPLIYSDYKFNMINDSFELTSKWADKKANVTRLYAPMSGREGVQLSIEFAKNTTFCLAALRLPDFSQGE